MKLSGVLRFPPLKHRIPYHAIRFIMRPASDYSNAYWAQNWRRQVAGLNESIRRSLSDSQQFFLFFGDQFIYFRHKLVRQFLHVILCATLIVF